MLRPTLAEILDGIQRTIMGTLFAELTSPYAQGQAAMIGADLSHVASSIESAPAYDLAEVADLTDTFTQLNALAASIADQARAAIDSGARAAQTSPPDRPAMEAAISELASALALGKIEGAIAEKVRGYLRRHLQRCHELLKSTWGG